MASLLEKVGAQEKAEVKKEKPPKRAAVNKIASSTDRAKDKQISAKVNTRTYEEFTMINKAQGLSNNSALNMIINRYVRENRGILEE